MKRLNPFRRRSEGGDGEEPPGPPARVDSDDERGLVERLVHSLAVRIAVGFALASGLAFGVYALFFAPAPVVLAPRVVNIPLPTPTFEPIPFEDPTDFLAGLPRADITYGLTAAEDYDATAITTWPARFAESWLLTYGDGAGATMTVVAVQHFNEDDAIAAFDEFVAREEADAEAAQPSPSPEPSPAASVSPDPLIVPAPVRVKDVEVGASILVVHETTETVEDPDGGDPTEVQKTVGVAIWRNGTAVFIMTADPDAIADLFVEYGV